MTKKKAPSLLDVAGAVTGTLVAVGTIVMSIFPFAVPALVLIVVAAIPLLILPLALALVIALFAAPVVLVRRLVGRVSRSRFERGEPEVRDRDAMIHRPHVRPS